MIDFGSVYQLAEIDTRNQTVTAGQILQPKPARTPDILAAQASPLGRVYMDWSPMPFISQDMVGDPDTPGDASNPSPAAVVVFRDPRFMGRIPLLNASGAVPLTAKVTVNAAGQIVSQSMDGRQEH